jgi:hypothetical protein
VETKPRHPIAFIVVIISGRLVIVGIVSRVIVIAVAPRSAIRLTEASLE